MKKILTTILAVSMAFAGTTLSAQNLVAELGVGLSNTNFNALGYKANADLYGGTLGLSYEMPVYGNIGFAPGLRFGYFTKGDVDVYGYDSVAFTETYLEVPLDFNIHLPMSEDMSFVIFAGPTVDLGLTSRIKEATTSAEYEIYSGELSEYTKYSRFDVLIGGGIGLDVMDAVRFSLRYDYGLINRNGGNLTSGILRIHRSQLKLGVGFIF